VIVIEQEDFMAGEHLVKLEFRDNTNRSRPKLQVNLKYIDETAGPCQIIGILTHVW
jgi:hypothetical protein